MDMPKLSSDDFLECNEDKRFASIHQRELFNGLCWLYNMYPDLPKGVASGKTWTFEAFEQYLKDRLYP